MEPEVRLRSFLEAASQALVAVGSDGRIQMVNRRTEEMFGYSREEMLGQEVEILLPERYRAAHRGHRAGYFAEPHVRAMGAGMDLSARRKDGSEFPIEIGLSYLEAEDGILALGFVSDVTERKKAEGALRASEAKLRSFLEGAAQAIVTVGSDGRIQMVNRRTEEMFGYAREDLLGQTLEILMPERYRKAHVGYRGGFFAEPRVRTIGSGLELVGRHANGTEFPVEIGLSHVDTPEGMQAIGLISDITERVQVQELLAAANANLRRSNADLEQFTYTASHDLQEPLRMVTTYLQLIERHAQLDETAHEYLHFAVDGAQRMKTLIQDLLRFSRAGSQKLELRAVGMGELIETAELSLRAALEESGARVEIDAMPEIAADGGLLAQVLQNLIGNAVKFRKPGVTPRVRITAEAGGSEWVFGVHDNGIGIDPRHMARVFQIFERLHGSEEYPGSGVGLAIAQRIVERHGGRIWVEGNESGGTSFYFSIPMRTVPMSAAR